MPRVEPIKSKEDKDEGKERFIEKYPELPQPHFFWLLCGAVGKGKTTLILNMIEWGCIRVKYYKEIHWVSPTGVLDDDKVKKRLEEAKKKGVAVAFYRTDSDKFYDLILDKGETARRTPKLIIWEDATSGAARQSRDPRAVEAFTTRRRYRNSFMLVTHGFKSFDARVRDFVDTISMFNVPTNARMKQLCEELELGKDPMKTSILVESCFKQPHGFYTYYRPAERHMQSLEGEIVIEERQGESPAKRRKFGSDYEAPPEQSIPPTPLPTPEEVASLAS